MQFNLETDYALRCMMYLAEHQEECISSATLARTQGLHSVEHVQKVLRKLRNRELVKVKLGVNGGYYLGKQPEYCRMMMVPAPRKKQPKQRQP